MYKTIDEIPADLRWLAENVHEWPASKSARIYWSGCQACFIGDGTISHDFEIPGGPIGGPMHEYTRAEWQAARDIISGKPGWDEAPEGARILVQNGRTGRWRFGLYRSARFGDCEGPLWVGEGPGRWFDPGFPGRVLGDWRDTLEHRPTDHANELLDGDAPEEGEEREETLADLYPKYYKDVTGLHSIDVYMTHELFGIDDPSGCIQHASKKLLLSGVRTGGKSKVDDIREARDTLTRWLEINE